MVATSLKIMDINIGENPGGNIDLTVLKGANWADERAKDDF